ncbi:hypothetical protein FGO68_gene2456 [Halteria grandinella]|uniref:Uncharacterized protein n=1 Tax=Halteria grandinella TaxID=5974 RepID=A0A8J8P188_HALGN|nr:hypothetical protein FGO68_gene2456 [Halteria grandinella]
MNFFKTRNITCSCAVKGTVSLTMSLRQRCKRKFCLIMLYIRFADSSVGLNPAQDSLHALLSVGLNLLGMSILQYQPCENFKRKAKVQTSLIMLYCYMRSITELYRSNQEFSKIGNLLLPYNFFQGYALLWLKPRPYAPFVSMFLSA